LTDLDQGQFKIWPDDRHRDPWDAGAGSHIRNLPGFPWKWLEEGKAIENDASEHPGTVGRPDQPMAFLPFHQ
jgi:hypothetical protein